MLNLVPGTLITIHKVESSKLSFLWYCDKVVHSHFLSRIQGVVINCYTSGESWKQVIKFF